LAFDNSKYQDVFPEGVYRVKVNQQAMGKSENTGNIFLRLKCDILSLKKGGNGSEIKPGRRFIDLYFTEATIERTNAFLEAAGFDFSTYGKLDPDHSEHFSLEGFEFDANCKHEVYNEKTRDKFSALPVGKSSTAWMEKLGKTDRVSVMGLDAMYGSALKKNSSVASQKPASVSTTSPWD
jgi:hypothetical protein